MPLLVLFLTSIGIEVHTISKILLCRDVKNWRASEGKVLRMEVAENSTAKKTYYRIDLSYEYFANKIRYVSTTIHALGNLSYTDLQAQALAQQYAIDSVVIVHHSPHNPAQSYLQRDVDFGSYFMVVAAPIFGLVMGYGVFFWFQKRFRSWRSEVTKKSPT